KSILQRDPRAQEAFVSKLNGHKSEVCGLKWSYDNREIASGGNDNRRQSQMSASNNMQLPTHSVLSVVMDAVSEGPSQSYVSYHMHFQQHNLNSMRNDQSGRSASDSIYDVKSPVSEHGHTGPTYGQSNQVHQYLTVQPSILFSSYASTVPSPLQTSRSSLKIISQHSQRTTRGSPTILDLHYTSPSAILPARNGNVHGYLGKRAKHLCFYCDQRYKTSPGHKCSGHMYCLEVIACNEEIEDEDCVLTEQGVASVTGSEEETMPQISLNAMTGVNNYQTMRAGGHVGKQLLHILVDCGSTHNFLDLNDAKRCVLIGTP
ncbi:reverse transcriptase, partial [Tanacetum coccineum]